MSDAELEQPTQPQAESQAAPPAASDDLQQFRADFESARRQIAEVVVGQDPVIELALTALVAGGHLLVEGMPGLGKTLLARTIADALNLDFRRLQFTPDLMPADVVGTFVVMESHGRRKFEFQQGPIFTNVLLADEINRATPKTQSALLEGLQDFEVTVGNQTYELPSPFFVLATRSEDETEGTFPLPETELDRFMFNVRMPLPAMDDLDTILARMTATHEPAAEQVLDGDQIVAMAQAARKVTIGDDVCRFVSRVIVASHPAADFAPATVKQFVRRGVSPRGGQAMILAAKVRALLDGRVHVAREDLQNVAPAALRHRLALNYEGHASRVDPDQIIGEILTAANA